MQEKNKNKNNHSNSLGICQRLFNSFMNSVIVRGLKRLTWGQSSEEIWVEDNDRENSEYDSGSEMKILFKESEEELGSWTPVDPAVSESEQPPGGKKKLRAPLNVAPNINERVEEFIRKKKEDMTRNMVIETKQKDQSLSGS